MPGTTSRTDARRARLRRHPRRLTTPWRLFALVFVAVFALGSSTWAASAYWTATVGVGGTTTDAATAAVSATGTGGLSYEYKVPVSNPGTAATRVAPVTFQNTGSAPLALTVGITTTNATLAGAITLGFWSQSSCGSTIPSGTVTGTLASPPALPSAAQTVPAGASVQLCVGTVLTGTTAGSQGQTVTATLTLTGRVGTNWVATSQAPVFTQSVYRVPDPTNLTCTNGTGGAAGTVTLSWTAATGATAYRVIRTNVTPAAQIKGDLTTTSVQLAASDFPLLTLGNLPLLVRSADSVYGTTSAGAGITLQVTLLTVLGLRCP